ncbi:MAG TPA: SDR family NAD(P)-dependent oxidoreductase [Ktedonobacterales bacterium]|nr:SDR family NAD(P)-dependent oxidoreductase [Ktedonobacterales bacterium]
MSSLPLEGKRAVVTGASKGIGRSIAFAFAREGATLALVARGHDELEALAREIREAGGHAEAIPADVTNAEQVRRMADATHAALGGVDILVNCAGAAESHDFPRHPDELWHRMLAVNLTSVYYVCRAFVPGMITLPSARIINVASIAAKTGGRYIAAYTASKHGVLGLTRALASELVRYNITVNAICPGYVDTPMTEASIANIAARTGSTQEQARAALELTSPQKRLIAPDEVAAVALFLARDASYGITGQAINVDGGAVMY